jgi:dihydrodipicolinate synthase/N-acetylneuraminate lyase
MNIIPIILGFVFVIPVTYIFVLSWFFPKSLLKLYRAIKEKDMQKLPFIPERFLNLIIFNDNKTITIIWARFCSLLMLGLSIIFIIAAFES